MRSLVELLVSFAFGVAAAVVPVFNNEAYVVGTRAAGLAGLVPVVLGLGLGNGLGKALVVVLVRQGRRLPWWRRPTTDVADAAAPRRPATSLGRATDWWGRQTRTLLALVGDPRWGVPLVALSAATSVPPIYPVTLLAATTRMSLAWFWLAATAGSLVRMLVLALLARGVLG